MHIYISLVSIRTDKFVKVIVSVGVSVNGSEEKTGDSRLVGEEGKTLSAGTVGGVRSGILSVAGKVGEEWTGREELVEKASVKRSVAETRYGWEAGSFTILEGNRVLSMGIGASGGGNNGHGGVPFCK